MKKRTNQIFRLIYCEGPNDIPYVRAFVKSAHKFFKPNNLWLPKVDCGYRGSQYQLVEGASAALRRVNEPSSRALVLIDADRGAVDPNEKQKAIATAGRLSERHGKLTLIFFEPCIEGFLLDLHNRRKQHYSSTRCKRELECLCSVLKGNSRKPLDLNRLYSFDSIELSHSPLGAVELLRWLELI